jgi:hypothetical protein
MRFLIGGALVEARVKEARSVFDQEVEKGTLSSRSLVLASAAFSTSCLLGCRRPVSPAK